MFFLRLDCFRDRNWMQPVYQETLFSLCLLLRSSVWSTFRVSSWATHQWIARRCRERERERHHGSQMISGNLPKETIYQDEARLGTAEIHRERLRPDLFFRKNCAPGPLDPRATSRSSRTWSKTKRRKNVQYQGIPGSSNGCPIDYLTLLTGLHWAPVGSARYTTDTCCFGSKYILRRR